MLCTRANPFFTSKPTFGTTVRLTSNAQIHPQLPACSGLVERIFSMPTNLYTPWDSYDSLALLAIKTVPTVDCNIHTIPGCWSWGAGNTNNIQLNFAAEVRGHVMSTLHSSTSCNAGCMWIASPGPHPTLP